MHVACFGRAEGGSFVRTAARVVTLLPLVGRVHGDPHVVHDRSRIRQNRRWRLPVGGDIALVEPAELVAVTATASVCAMSALVIT